MSRCHHDFVEHENGIHACTCKGCDAIGIEREQTIGGGGDIEQDVMTIRELEPLTVAIHLAQMCEDIDYFRKKGYGDMPRALIEQREGVKANLDL